MNSDETYLYELYCDNRRNEIMSWGFSETEARAFLWTQFQMRKRHYENFYPESEHYIIIKDGNEVGSFIVSRQGEQWTLVDIAIHSTYQRQGIGTAVLGKLIEAFHEQIYAQSFKLSVLKGSDAVKLYIKHGFQLDEDHEIYNKMLIKK